MSWIGAVFADTPWACHLEDANVQLIDFQQVQSVTNRLSTSLENCGHVEGTKGADFDAQLSASADIFLSFLTYIRNWTGLVFRGLAIFDDSADLLCKAVLLEFISRGTSLSNAAKQSETEYFTFQHRAKLESVLFSMHHSLSNWSRPRRSVSPGWRIRLQYSPDENARIQNKIDSLPRLDPDWVAEPGQFCSLIIRQSCDSKQLWHIQATSFPQRDEPHMSDRHIEPTTNHSKRIPLRFPHRMGTASALG
jgi:hypothetical protein